MSHYPVVVFDLDGTQRLTAARVSLLLGTITWRFAGEMLRQHHDFAAVSGTEMQADDGVLSGAVSRYFDEHG